MFWRKPGNQGYTYQARSCPAGPSVIYQVYVSYPVHESSLTLDSLRGQVSDKHHLVVNQAQQIT